MASETSTERTETVAYAQRIRTAYRQAVADLGKRPGDFVILTELRPYVGGYRAEVDAALVRLAGEPDVELIGKEARWELSDADHEAAVWAGNEDRHLLAIHP